MLAKSEKDMFLNEIEVLKQENLSLKQKNTLLTEQDEIKKAIDNLSVMFLQKGEDLLTQK